MDLSYLPQISSFDRDYPASCTSMGATSAVYCKLCQYPFIRLGVVLTRNMDRRTDRMISIYPLSQITVCWRYSNLTPT